MTKTQTASEPLALSFRGGTDTQQKDPEPPSGDVDGTSATLNESTFEAEVETQIAASEGEEETKEDKQTVTAVNGEVEEQESDVEITCAHTKPMSLLSVAVPSSGRPIPMAPRLPNSFQSPGAPQFAIPRGQLSESRPSKKLKCLHWIPMRELEV
jgi:hypothetical protein